MPILIADDDAASLKLLQIMLEKMGYRVILAEDGAQAWQQFEEQRPQIIISDWIMPNMDGLELCRKIKAASNENYTCVIIVTGRSNKKDLIEAFNAGADDFLAKPFDPEELRVRLNNCERILQLEQRHQNLQRVLVHSRNKLRTVLDGLHEEIAAIDRFGRIISLNLAAVEAMKGDYAELIGKNLFELNHKLSEPIWAGKAEQLSRKVLETGAAEFCLDECNDSQRNSKFRQQSFLPVREENGQVDQVILVSRDVTQEHKTTAEIKKLNNRLKQTTIEVNAKNLKLEAALKKLEETQGQILQSEKMASIGQLAAGVAHEINNPVGFVSSNLRTLGDYRLDLEKIIAQYRAFVQAIRKKSKEISLPPEIMTGLETIEQSEEQIDIDYIQKDFGDLVQESVEGTERIRKIVLDLKDFAHPGEDKPKETDINTGLESTLNVVHNELKYKAKIIKSYGELPIVQCYPQQINQVFMNILVNAAQAIETSGEIKIETEFKDQMVEVRISDTGCGIPQENLTRIFEPFFTTKDVGKGTGLGMNIAYNIVKKHNGAITVKSKVGVGTTFTVRLPLTLPQAEPAG